MTSDRVTFTLNHLVGEINRSADRILRERFGLTYSQFLFLVTLDSTGQVPSSVLAHELGVSRAAVSKRTSWFESRGLASSQPSAVDYRVVELSITAEGHRLAIQMGDTLEKQFRQRFVGLHGVDLDQLNRDLHALLSHFSEHSTTRRGEEVAA
ncbi:MarR family winged helix-turn-helix transcriptional regulator [Pontimonas sp.]|jgi:DNA-binding MarR family transcriptional regulator|uniref:MarR family winged helix-turn-helix transcriptional regulator n=1 Tax=Pontimonas sp. TaxID=2304492 RepID=UPI00286FAFF6|nr:MarR family winged helix-turn-helix transcriptional regulator [Pontimonas sp.]MDR9396004.1 MarR family winged helix-turn-helix transcriptional regulator [Pontimonas sp.]MDR9435147.1 MarR family winged helix-turn-helix transcriptional regulator [Pontimonas sp.]